MRLGAGAGGEGKPAGGEGGQKKEKKEKKKPDAAAAPAGNEKLEAFGKSQLQIGEVCERRAYGPLGGPRVQFQFALLRSLADPAS